MPDYSSILGTIGYDASSLQDLFGQYFQDVDPRWSQHLAPSFKTAQTALGELPGMRREMTGQLMGGLQQRGVTAARGLQSRRAGAGFAGFGALDELGRTTRAGFEREAGLGRFRIGEDIARKRAGVLGTLSGKVGGFLSQLLAAGTEAAGDGRGGGGDDGLDRYKKKLLDPLIQPEDIEVPTGAAAWQDWEEAASSFGADISRANFLAYIERFNEGDLRPGDPGFGG